MRGGFLPPCLGKPGNLMSLTNQENQLPYFTVPECNLRVLVDTGSTRSFIKPNKARKYFNPYIREDQFEIRTPHGRSKEKHSITIPAFSIFKSDKKLKFHLFDFHEYFDCLIGIDTVKALGLCVDVPNGTMKSESATIKLELRDTETELHRIGIYPECEQVIEIRVKNIENGEVIIPERKIGECTIQEGIARVENGKTWCTIINPTKEEITLYTKPTSCEEFTKNYEIVKREPNLNNMDSPSTFSFDLIRSEHLNEEEKLKLEDLLEQYSEIFHIEGNQLSFTNQIKHIIRTHDEMPIHTKPYRYPEIHREEVRTQINKMLEQGIIRPSHSPWSSPIWIVPKKMDASGKRKWRIVIDYRKLNDKTIDDRYPLPNITDLLDKLGRCQYFTTLDLASGFYQIEMDDESIPKTAFNAEHGHYEYVRMPMGLKNSPSTFQRVMDNVLRGLVNECCLVYLDDIIIFGPSLSDHIQNLRKVFDRLRKFNLKIQLDKSEFLRKEVEYLGHVVTTEGVRPNPVKIEAIRQYPIPKTTTQIKSFLGLLGYYRRFIKDFAKLTKPLTKCLKKDAVIDIQNLEYKQCFEKCKNVLLEEPVLQYPDFTKTFNLTTDASNFAIGAVLSQGVIGKDKPIAFASRTLNDHEKNYSTTEKELLSIVWSVKHFRPYLYGRKFIIVTDHKPLQWLFSVKDPSSKLIRWRLRLEEYEYEITYKKGKQNTNADALSRIELNHNQMSAIQKYVQEARRGLSEETTQSDNIPSTSTEQVGTQENSREEEIPTFIQDIDIDNLSIAVQADTSIIDFNEEELNDLMNQLGDDLLEVESTASFYEDFAQTVAEENFEVPVITFKIPVSQEQIEESPQEESQHLVTTENPPTNAAPSESSDINTVHSSDENPLIGIPISEKSINVSRNQIVMRGVSITPKPTKRSVLHKTKHRIVVEIPLDKPEQYLKDFVDQWISPDTPYGIYFETPSLYETFSRVLQMHFKGSKIDITKASKKLQDIVKEKEKTEIIKQQHEGITNHRGIQETYNQLKEIYYWPDMVGNIQKYINQCKECQVTKYDRKPLKPFFNKTPTATRPFEIVHMDTISIEKTKFLTIVDSFSKFAQVYALPSAQAIDVAEKLLESFSHHGLPTLIITDNGTEFKNTTVQELLAFHKVELHFNSSQNPNSNGIVERYHSTLIEHIRVFNNRDEFKSEPIFIKIKYAVLAYNHSIHSVTKLRPIQLVTGHFDSTEPVAVDLEQKLASNYLNSHREKMKIVHERIHQTIEENKQQVIDKRNVNREPLPREIPDTVYVVNKQKQSKTKNKYKAEQIASINKDLKTAKIVKSHKNTSERIHLSNIKRPPKNVSGSSTEPLPGPSQMEQD
ncbi:hypothetical protein WDU94_006581 [Cyamophila willieti]